MPAFCDVVKKLRQEKGLTQEGLAEALTNVGEEKITRSAVGMWESGQRIPKFEVMETVADYFNVDIDYLLGRAEKINWLQFFAEKPLGEKHRKLIQFFDSLEPSAQDLILAQLQGAAQSQKDRDDH